MPSLRSVAAFLIGLVLLTAPAAATWSIVIVDLATGEVAVGIATCLTGFDLRPNTVVVVPGHGVAAAQSYVGPLTLRQMIRDGFLNGTSATQILAQLAAADANHQMRQYGIVSLTGGEVTFTGSQAGVWAGGLTGQSGTLRYAIQGNVLTGQPVVTQAELAIQNTPGTIADKLMAAMEAARLMGGDGRCSCSPSNPPGCGSPPPSFSKSSHIALMIVSRPSDLDVPCGGPGGCGGGDYWLDINIANQPASAPDPVLQLQGLYQTWKANQVGRPDHYQSDVTLSGTSIRADGVQTVTATVELRDASGNPLGNSLPLTVGLAPESTVPNVTFGPVTPLANGKYEFTIAGALRKGVASIDVAAVDQFGRVGIWPRPSLVIDDVFGPCGAGGVPDGAGGVVDALTIDGSAGVDRVVDVGFAQPFTLSLVPPATGGSGLPIGMFALWAHDGIPSPAVNLPIPGGASSLCFTPAPLLASAPTALIVDTFGLGGALSSGPAPWTLSLPGLPILLDATLQAAMVVDMQGTFASSNAVLLRVRPLPAPVIQSIQPAAPAAGQSVTVAGSDFYQNMSGAIDGVPVVVNYVSPTEVQFTMPAGVVCDAQLALANASGAGTTATINPTPVVLSVPVSSGPAAGGGPLYIVGQHLLGATVTVGGQPMVVSSQTDFTVIGSAPPGSPGPAQILVVSPNGCQTTATYTYQ